MHDVMERVHTTPYSNSRNQFARLTLTEGRYCILPTTFEPNTYCQFILRVYSYSDPSLK